MTRGHGYTATLFLRLLLIFCGFTAPAVANTIHVPADQPTIQAGINAANPGDTVLVAPGTYYENIDFKGKAIMVTSSGGAATTIIDGGGIAATVSFVTNELRSSVLSGFTVRNGGISANGNGSGIYIGGAAPTILNNVITSNMCDGIDAEFSAPLIQNNTISATLQSSCGWSGAGVALGGDYYSFTGLNTALIGNIIENNLHSDQYSGGAIIIWASDTAVIENNIIRNNNVDGDGGAIAMFNSDNLELVQNLILNNSASYTGASLSLHPPEQSVGQPVSIIANNTFAGNFFTGNNVTQLDVAGDIYLDGNLAQWVFTNNIVTDSMAQPALVCGTIYNYLSITPLVIDHNDLFNTGGPAYGGACDDKTGTYGNISADPLFNNPANGDYTLKPGSPAIDTGNTSVLADLRALAQGSITLSTDFAGNPRVQDATGLGYAVIDMGAYEASGPQDPEATTIVLTPSVYQTSAGLPVTLTAQLYSHAGTPGGTVAFFEDGTALGTSVLATDGTATSSIGSLTPGIHAFVASYAGQGAFEPGVSIKIYIFVDKYQPTITISSTANPSYLNQPVTFNVLVSSPDQATLSPITLTEDYSTVLAQLTPDSTGKASYTTSSLAVGYHDIQASYAGDSAHNAASADVEQQVLAGYPTNTAVTCQPASIGVGGTVLFTASVTSANGTPTGSVTFNDQVLALSTKSLVNGTASYSYTYAYATTYTMTATYNPTGTFAGSSATCSVIVAALPSTSTLKVSPQTAMAGSPVLLTANVSATNQPGPATPTGTVTFSSNGAIIGQANLNAGLASITLNNLAAGTDQLTCQYSGDPVYQASPCNIVPVTISAIPVALSLTSSLNPANAFQPVTLTAHLSSTSQNFTPSGQIAFFSNGAPIGTSALNSSGSATLPVNFPAGTDILTASYASTPACTCESAQSNAITEVVTQDSTTTSLTVSPNSAAQGSTITLTAQITPSSSQPAPSGAVIFYDGINSLASVPVSASGSATFTSSTFAVGTHSLTAAYSGNSNDLPSTSDPQTLTINAQNFILSAPATLTIQTEHHADLKLTLTSVGNFADTVNLNCGELPKWTVCHFDEAPPSLGPNQTVSTSIYIETDAVLGYKSELRAPFVLRSGIALAMLLPLGLLAVPRRRQLLKRSGVLIALVLTASLLSLTGCSGLYPPSTTPGTYTITLTGQGAQTGMVKTTTFSLIVTP